ncbi:endonuclease/exonuclease/phosphatase family protein [Galbibacter pacificus]|uniref:Endonuclease/exonuclease/phosphatase family protein n=1 Tax=Galbibacter pacificus TaxID=2996052 RepID=A0ABT6FUF6_9FLAO|nr:endonuclease/exonuclease/phosphatase family protein [Galbibacter pacificus]MDG3583265.1 endonuclease/exonuclease/phosphatase family protein [Galbibacter pacificus]MDG3586746.1 endonuclease/exonuclease/phosphatase family protein [Galbibacter pacificus]
MNENNLHTIAFYNLENLFDTLNDPHILDDDFTEDGRLNWTKERYENKIHKLAMAISKIGKESNEAPPVVIGLAEVENKKVLNDLVNAGPLVKHNYNFAHFNSPDERGIDTALLYRKEYFEFIDAEPIPLLVYDKGHIRDRTRDILYVVGKLNNERVHIFVNHWPSRRQGAEETSYKRITAANRVTARIGQIKKEEENPRLIIMGDFNDDPNSPSIKEHLLQPDLYNPMETLLIPLERGSLTHKANWNLFDQIMISTNFFDVSNNNLKFLKADILDVHFLEEWNEKYKGFPFRTYVGKKYLGGYSDHFPVYILLKEK